MQSMGHGLVERSHAPLGVHWAVTAPSSSHRSQWQRAPAAHGSPTAGGAAGQGEGASVPTSADIEA
jgi:hypothetical protein